MALPPGAALPAAPRRWHLHPSTNIVGGGRVAVPHSDVLILSSHGLLHHMLPLVRRAWTLEAADNMVLNLNGESPRGSATSSSSPPDSVTFRFDLLGESADEEGCLPPVMKHQIVPSPDATAVVAMSDESPPPLPDSFPLPAADLGVAQKVVTGGASVKKSRRGPRSRSLQYRGVTFCSLQEDWPL